MSEAVDRLESALATTPGLIVGQHLTIREVTEAMVRNNPALAEALELGLSWQAAVAALPEGWWVQLDAVGGDRYHRVQAGERQWSREYHSLIATAATPAEALRQLAAKLNP